MNMYEACQHIESDIASSVYYDGALLIQFFYMEIENGETPRMALVLARKALAEPESLEAKKDIT